MPERLSEGHLVLRESRCGTTIRLSLLGELDLAVARRVDRRLSELAVAGQPAVISLEGLTFIDSTGVAVIVRALNMREHGWRVTFTAPERLCAEVRKVLTMTGIHQLMWPADRADGAAPSP